MGAVSSSNCNDDMVTKLIDASYIKTAPVERAFRMVDRAHYVKSESPYSDGAWKRNKLHVSAPCIYAQVMEALLFEPGQSFLNIGSGTGYLNTLAGVILGGEGTNHGVELYSEAVKFANDRLKSFKLMDCYDGYNFAEPVFVEGNAFFLLPPHTCYDRIYVGAAIPLSFLDVLRDYFLKVGGIIVAPVLSSMGHTELVQVYKESIDRDICSNLHDVSFAHLIFLLPGQRRKITKNCTVSLPCHRVKSLQEVVRSYIVKHIKRKILEEKPQRGDMFSPVLASEKCPKLPTKPSLEYFETKSNLRYSRGIAPYVSGLEMFDNDMSSGDSAGESSVQSEVVHDDSDSEFRRAQAGDSGAVPSFDAHFSLEDMFVHDSPPLRTFRRFEVGSRTRRESSLLQRRSKRDELQEEVKEPINSQSYDASISEASPSKASKTAEKIEQNSLNDDSSKAVDQAPNNVSSSVHPLFTFADEKVENYIRHSFALTQTNNTGYRDDLKVYRVCCKRLVDLLRHLRHDTMKFEIANKHPVFVMNSNHRNIERERMSKYFRVQSSSDAGTGFISPRPFVRLISHLPREDSQAHSSMTHDEDDLARNSPPINPISVSRPDDNLQENFTNSIERVITSIRRDLDEVSIMFKSAHASSSSEDTLEQTHNESETCPEALCEGQVSGLVADDQKLETEKNTVEGQALGKISVCTNSDDNYVTCLPSTGAEVDDSELQQSSENSERPSDGVGGGGRKRNLSNVGGGSCSRKRYNVSSSSTEVYIPKLVSPAENAMSEILSLSNGSLEEGNATANSDAEASSAVACSDINATEIAAEVIRMNNRCNLSTEEIRRDSTLGRELSRLERRLNTPVSPVFLSGLYNNSSVKQNDTPSPDEESCDFSTEVEDSDLDETSDSSYEDMDNADSTSDKDDEAPDEESTGHTLMLKRQNWSTNDEGLTGSEDELEYFQKNFPARQYSTQKKVLKKKNRKYPQRYEEKGRLWRRGCDGFDSYIDSRHSRRMFKKLPVERKLECCLMSRLQRLPLPAVIMELVKTARYSKVTRPYSKPVVDVDEVEDSLC